MILAIKTDNPTAELYLLNSKGEVRSEDVWRADRELSVQILQHIEQLLRAEDKEYSDLKGIVAFEGPGSFTGLRIGITVANTLAFSLSIPIAGACGDDWKIEASKQLATYEEGTYLTPHYGGEANITAPKK